MNKTKYSLKDVDWEEMNAIGISMEFLEVNGLLGTFLNGEVTEPINMDTVLLGNEVNIDATLQVINKGESPIVNIVCIKPEEVEVEMY